MDERFPVDGDTARSWVAVAHGARLANHILRAVQDPPPGSNFEQVNERYPWEKASDWHRAYLIAALEHLLLWADLAAPFKFHPEQEVTHAFRPAYTLARAALESAAQAVWMSGGDNADECARRHLSLIRWDYDEHRKSLRDVTAKDEVRALDAKLLRRCSARFTEQDLTKPSHLTVLRAAAPIAGIQPDDMERMWRAASGAAHGRRWASLALQQVVPVEEYEPGQFRALTVPDPDGMTEILDTAQALTFHGVLRHAAFCDADIQVLLDNARLWLVSVVPFRGDADPSVIAHLARQPGADAS